MLIANPIYDVFFKFLMEDSKIAMKLISTIIGQEIIDIVLKPQETSIKLPDHFLSVIRLDFKATILTKENTRIKVLIELQKGKNPFDITRFRKYLGENYIKKDTITNDSGISTEANLPIIAIYFIGFKLNNILTSVLKANHQYFDMVGNKSLTVKNDFVEQLIHDCFVVQIPRLTLNLKTDLEKILLIFNQSFVIDGDTKRLQIPDQYIDDPFIKELIERLGKPLLSEQLLKQADLEDEILTKFEEMAREIEERDKIIEDLKKRLGEK
jgi:hypothetical protein